MSSRPTPSGVIRTDLAKEGIEDRFAVEAVSSPSNITHLTLTHRQPTQLARPDPDAADTTAIVSLSNVLS